MRVSLCVCEYMYMCVSMCVCEYMCGYWNVCARGRDKNVWEDERKEPRGGASKR